MVCNRSMEPVRVGNRASKKNQRVKKAGARQAKPGELKTRLIKKRSLPSKAGRVENPADQKAGARQAKPGELRNLADHKAELARQSQAS